MAKKLDVWTYNFAKNERIRDAITKLVIPKIASVRENRKEAEDDWMRFHNMWNVKHDGSHTYNGRAKLYVPEVRKNVEAQARQIVDTAFPNDDFFDVSPGSGGTKKGALIHKSIRRWQIENAQLRVKFHPFARQECLYGTSPAYICWNRKVEHAFRSARNSKTGKIQMRRELVEIYNGPDFITRDLFKWYALNPQKADITEDGCVDFTVENYFDLLAQDKAGYLWKIDEIAKGNNDAYQMDELMRDIERAEQMGLRIENDKGYAGSASLKAPSEDSEGERGTHLVATVYLKLACAEACLEGEDPDMPIPFKIKIYNDKHIGFAGRNPFFHQRPPYVVGKYILPNADEFYGQGIPWAIQFQQYELNSKAEQSMDSTTLALNPIAFIDPAMAAQSGNFEIEPGATWYVSPQSAKFAAMPDVSPAGYQAMSMIRQQMMEYSDRAPALPPQLMGKSRSATQAEIVDRAVSIDHKTFQMQNEIMVLQPVMEMWESLTDQNITDDQVVMLLGRRSTDWRRTVITKNQTLGRYQYFWKASSFVQNKSIIARQMIDMMKVASMLPPDQQQKLMLDYAEIYRVLWTEMFNLPDADKIIGYGQDFEAQDPEVCFKMLVQGMEVEILPSDDNQKHMAFLDARLKSLPEGQLKVDVMRLIAQHSMALQMKQEMAKRAELMRQQQMAIAQAQAGGGQGGKKSAGSGNRAQLSPNANAGDQGSGTRA